MTQEIERLSNWPQKLFVAEPRGFCAGVIRAVDALNLAVEQSNGEPIYSFHEIIHNTHVVKDFEQRGVVFVDSVEEVPEGSILFLSAHGVSPQIKDLAEKRRMRVVDATCPLVTKTHMEAKRFLAEGRTVLYIGHANHDETVGTLGYAPRMRLIEKVEDVATVDVEDPDKVALITQTTLSMDDTAKIRAAILERFPNTAQPRTSDICFATQNRQNGVKEMIGRKAEAVVVVGSPKSSNSQRLNEVTIQHDVDGFFVDQAAALNPDNFTDYEVIGLTSGASVPEDKFQEVVDFFVERGTQVVQPVKVADESFGFELPKGLDKLTKIAS